MPSPRTPLLREAHGGRVGGLTIRLLHKTSTESAPFCHPVT